MALREELILDLSAAQAAAAAFDAEVSKPIEVPVLIDTASAQAEIEGLDPEAIETTVEVDTTAATAEIEGLDPGTIDAEVTVDTFAAEQEIEGLDPGQIEVPVTVDTAAAEAELENLDPGIIEAVVEVDTTSAAAEIEGLGGGVISGGTVDLDTGPAESSIDGLGVLIGQASTKFSGLLGGAGGAGGALGRLAGSATAAGGSIAALAGPLAVAAAGFLTLKEASDFFTENVDEAAALEQAIAKTTNVFGEFADEGIAAFTGVSDSMLLSDTAALQMGSTLGNLFIAMGQTEAEALAMAEGVTTLAADLSSFNDVPVDDVLLALRAGLIGETEPLRRFGVALSQARVEAEALAQGIIEQGETVSAQDAVLLRYQLIMEDTALAHGDVARSSGQLTIEQAKNAAAFENLATTAGTFLIPAFAGIAETIGDDLIPALTDLVEVVGPVFASLAEGVGGFAQGIITGIGDTADVLEDLFRFGERIVLKVSGEADTSAFLDVQAQLDELLETAPDAAVAVGDILDTLDDPRWGEAGVPLTIEQLRALGEQAGLTTDELTDVIGARIGELRAQLATGIAPPGAQAQLDSLVLAYDALTTAAEGGIDAISEHGNVVVTAATQAGGAGSKWGLTALDIVQASRVMTDAISEVGTSLETVGGGALIAPTLPPVDTSQFSASLGTIDGMVLSLGPALNLAGAELGRTLTSGFEQAIATTGPTLGPLIDGLIHPASIARVDIGVRQMLDAIRNVPELLGVAVDEVTPEMEALVERIHIIDAIPQVIRDAADGVGGGVEQLTTVLKEGGPEVALSADQFVTNLGESVAQATEFSDNLKTLAKRGQEDLAAELLALGPAAADVTEQFVEDVGAAEEGERILDEAGTQWIDDGLRPAVESAIDDLAADNPVLAGFLTMVEGLDSPALRNRIATLVNRIFQDSIDAAAAAAAQGVPPAPVGGGAGGGGAGAGGGGATGGRGISAEGPTLNLTINNPTARDIEEETGRLAQQVAAVGVLLGAQ
jgi:hypothetical protein